MEVASLLSPPEAKRPEPSMASNAQPFTPQTSFNFLHQLPPLAKLQQTSQSRLPLSPPESPFRRTSKDSPSVSPRTVPVRDPELYPLEDDNSPTEASPLFPLEQPDQELADAVDRHMMARTKAQAKTLPTKDEYMLMGRMVSIVNKQFSKDPVGWAKREREWLRQARGSPARVEKKKSGKPTLRKLAPKVASGQTGASSASKKPKPVESAPKVKRAQRTPKSTPKAQASDSFDNTNSSVVTKAPRSSNKDDVQWWTVTDYTVHLPPLDGKSMKIDWKGTSMDLSNDPQRHLLPDQELQLAGTLRLSPAQYLTTKRRIFEGRLGCAIKGKEFRKTDAQQAGHIDVNKASKLWQAFDKVGWLDIKYVKPFM